VSAFCKVALVQPSARLEDVGNVSVIEVAGALLLSAALAVLFFKYHREVKEEIERFKNNFPGGGAPGSPMHPSPANDNALLGRKLHKDVQTTEVKRPLPVDLR
jgi:hypothetical protein